MRLKLLDKLQCPDCRSLSRLVLEVERGDGETVLEGRLSCSDCGSFFAIENGIPNLLPSFLQQSFSGEQPPDEVRQKRKQIEHFNSIGATELEISRPHGCGRVYNFLLNTKFQIVTELLGRSIEGCSILNVCCGSGMDTEFLARSGAVVVGIDISVGALRGAQQRAERYDVTYDLIVGDAEMLPVRDGAFDMAFVHDGLHHLVSPELGFLEMARTSTKAVLITEPARAFVTEIGMRLSVADAIEESGSKVYRFSEDELRKLCAKAQLNEPRMNRYAMYYRQQPLKIFRLFDQPWTYPTFVFMFRFFNLILGGVGNKIALVAER